MRLFALGDFWARGMDSKTWVVFGAMPKNRLGCSHWGDVPEK
jgi:hypothetical protein